MRPISDFRTEHNGVVDYVGHIDLDLVTDPVVKSMLMQATYGPVEVAGKLYTRFGMFKQGEGTHVKTEEDFQEYYNAYGQVMMDEKEWAQFLLDNQPQEVE